MPKIDPTKYYKIYCPCGAKHIVGPGLAEKCLCGATYSIWRLEKDAEKLTFNQVFLKTATPESLG
jgi:hypothetical protein